MCGITGFYASPQSPDSYPATISRMLSQIVHRGPDETGYYIDDRIALGIARLSIIDLDGGTQPMSDRNGRFWLCYNGELYNYKELRAELEQTAGQSFVTHSDTEVVLEAWLRWRENCLPRFNGAFAFAIYDTQEDVLFLARDRFGKRPLFYLERDAEFVFASEMKAFLGYEGVNFSLAARQLASIFATWTPLPDQTEFEGIRQLPAGAYLVVRRGRSNGWISYERLELAPEPLECSEAEAAERAVNILSESVKLRLQSDVATGIYLSGGLDSSIVTLLATEASAQQVRTFSVEFEDPTFDESEEQRSVSDHLGTNHSPIRISYKQIAENFPQALFHAEFPVFRTAFVPMFLLSKHVREAGVKVVLTGEGADEAFLGYDIFKEVLLRASWNRIGSDERRSKLSRMYPFLGHFGPEHHSHLMGLYQQFSVELMPGLFSHEIRFQNGRFAARLLQERAEPFRELSQLIEAEPGYSDLSHVQKAQWLEFKTLLAGYLLSTQGERMTLAHGVENRCPFLDPRVVSFAASINLRFNDGFDEKYLLKRAFEGRLPARILKRHKHPYRAPDSVSFVAHQPDYLDLLRSEAELRKLEVLDTKFALALTRKIMSTPADRISTKENQAFIFLLSTVLLHHFFVKREGLVATRHPALESARVKLVDRRSNISQPEPQRHDLVARQN